MQRSRTLEVLLRAADQLAQPSSPREREAPTTLRISDLYTARLDPTILPV
jgi:hypothetical protein